jgi:hypothetical protein
MEYEHEETQHGDMKQVAPGDEAKGKDRRTPERASSYRPLGQWQKMPGIVALSRPGYYPNRRQEGF